MSDEKKEELKKADEVVEEKAPEITEDALLKTLKELEGIVKASKEPPQEEEEDEEEEEEEKSYTDNFDEDETIEKAIEVSDFLSTLVEQTETSLEGIGKDVTRMQKSMEAFDTKSIEALSKLGEVIKGFEKSFGEKFAAMDTRLQAIEQTPVSKPKSIVKSAQVIEKSAAGTGTANTLEQLPKRQLVELMEKAVIDGKIPDKDMIAFEASAAPISEANQEILKSYL